MTLISNSKNSHSVAKLRVIWVSPSYGYGGDLLYFKGLFEAFCQRFPETKILVDPKIQYREAEGIPLVPELRGWAWKRFRRVGGASYDATVHVPTPGSLSRLLALKPDVAITIEFTLVSLATLAMASLTKRFSTLLLVESNPAARGGGTGVVVQAVKRWACRRANAIQTSNEAGRRFLTDTLAADPEKIRVAPYLTSCPPRPSTPVNRVSDERLRILFANSLVTRKGPHTLLDALALLPEQIAERINLTIVGDGPERGALEQRAASLSGPSITFVGAKPYSALGSYYSLAQVLAVPSQADYRALAGFEGLAYGLALLASTADGASTETLDGGRTGIAIDPADPAGMAAAIRRFIEDPAFLARCQANARCLFEERFSFECITDNLAASIAAAHDARTALSKKK